MCDWVTDHYISSNKTKFLEKTTIKIGYTQLIAHLKLNDHSASQIGNDFIHKKFSAEFPNFCMVVSPIVPAEKNIKMHSSDFITQIIDICNNIKCPQICPQRFNEFPRIASWSESELNAALCLLQMLSFLRNTEMYYTSVEALSTRATTRLLEITIDNNTLAITTLCMFSKVRHHKSTHRGKHKFTVFIMAIKDGNSWYRTPMGKALCLLIQVGRNRTSAEKISWDAVVPPHLNSHSKKLEPLSVYHFTKAIRQIYKSLQPKTNCSLTSYANRRTSFAILIAIGINTDQIKACATWSDPKKMLNFYVGQKNMPIVDEFRNLRTDIRTLFALHSKAYEIYEHQPTYTVTPPLDDIYYNVEPDSDCDSLIGDFEMSLN